MKRATSSTAKAERHAAILAAAAETFDRLGFAETSMDWLAERAGIAKGTLYLYFPTKEAVFLALYRREFDTWLERIDAGIDGLSDDEAAAFAGLATDALAARPRLPALAAILHTVLERNIDEDGILAFKRHVLSKVAVTGRRLEGKLGFLAEDDGVRLLLRVHALVIGCWHASTPSSVARKALDHDGLAALRVDFHEELENTLVLVLEGWRHCGGGF